MKEIVVLSGKGGTGKTMLVAGCAALAKDVVLADCDVDAPNLHLLMRPSTIDKGDFTATRIAVIDGRRCTNCRRCADACRPGAIKLIGRGDLQKVAIDSGICEGCGVCMRVCPVDAVSLVDSKSGEWYVSRTPFGIMVHALLEPGGENSGKLVALVKHKAKELAAQTNARTVLVDGPPGIGCPAISTLSGADMAVIVTEPSRSGMSDLRRILELSNGFRVPLAIVINRYDTNRALSESITDEAKKVGIPVLGLVPFDEAVVLAMARGLSVVEGPDSPASEEIRHIWQRLEGMADCLASSDKRAECQEKCAPLP